MEDPADEMEHIELFRDPSDDGDDGGVWNVKLPSPLFVSLMTCSNEMAPNLKKVFGPQTPRPKDQAVSIISLKPYGYGS